MKRSEMIDFIHKNVSKVLCTLDEFNKSDCDRLLDAIETEGMMPPFNVDNKELEKEYIYVNNVDCYYEWEPEDDELSN